MNNYLYGHIMLFYDFGILLFKPLAALEGLKNKLPQVLKQHNVAIEVVIHTLIVDKLRKILLEYRVFATHIVDYL